MHLSIPKDETLHRVYVIDSVVLRNFFSGQQENHFDAQISHDEVLFCLGACRLSAENGDRASPKSVKKIRHLIILNLKKRLIKKKKKKRKKKKERHDTRVHLNESAGVEAIHKEGRGS